MSFVLSTSEQLLVSVDATATTAESSCRVSYADIRGPLGSSSLVTTGATPVLLAFSPPGTQWAISGIVLVNSDTVTHTYTFTTIPNGGDPIVAYKVSLQAGYSAQFDAKNWTVYNPQGLPVEGSGSGGVQSVNQGIGIAVNNSDPTNPIVALNSGTQADLALAVTAVQPAQLSLVTVGLDYISGLTLQYVSGTAINVTSGVAGIQSSEKLLNIGTQIGVSGLSLTASTWYHVYLYEAMIGGALTPVLDVSNTAPSGPYLGTARSKSGDTSRRYLGSILTDSSGSIYNFVWLTGGLVMYVQDQNSYGFFEVLVSGTATSVTPISISSQIPVTAVASFLRAQVSGGSYAFVMGGNSPSIYDADLVPAAGNPIGNNYGVCKISQDLRIFYQSNDSSTPLSVGVKGYYFVR